MIAIKRSKDCHGHVAWLATRQVPEESRSYQLYLGSDVNGAINAAIGAGMASCDAIAAAKAEVARGTQPEHNDSIVL